MQDSANCLGSTDFMLVSLLCSGSSLMLRKSLLKVLQHRRQGARRAYTVEPHPAVYGRQVCWIRQHRKHQALSSRVGSSTDLMQHVSSSPQFMSFGGNIWPRSPEQFKLPLRTNSAVFYSRT